MRPQSRQPAPSQRQLHQSLLTVATFRLCFKLARYGIFGEDYGPDLAFWAACRRLEPFGPARMPAGCRASRFGRGSVSGADLWMLSARIKPGSSKKSLSEHSLAV